MTSIWSSPTIWRIARLDFGEIALGFLEAAGRRRAHVQPHLAGVDLREKILAELREQQQRARHQQQ